MVPRTSTIDTLTSLASSALMVAHKKKAPKSVEDGQGMLDLVAAGATDLDPNYADIGDDSDATQMDLLDDEE